MMSEKVGNINKETVIIKKIQIEILEMKSITPQLKLKKITRELPQKI